MADIFELLKRKALEQYAKGQPYRDLFFKGDPSGVLAEMEAYKNLPEAERIQRATDIGMGFAGTIKGTMPNMSKYVPGVKAGEEMIAHHNITPEKLAKVQDVGGMPVPSIAISNIENPMEGFGQISLIGTKNMATPSRNNPVWAVDAYTSRSPNIEHFFDKKSSSNLNKLFSDVKDSLGGDKNINRLAEDWSNRQYSSLFQAKFLKEKGMLPNRQDFADDYSFKNAISETVNVNNDLYSDWLYQFEKNLPKYGVNVENKIFKGYTPSGNRKYAPVTLENLVKEMKGGAGSEGYNYGAGSIRAVATPKFKNMNEIQKSRDKLVSSSDMQAFKESANQSLADLENKMSKLENQAGYAYRPSDAIYDVAQSGNINLLDRLYKDVPNSLKKEVSEYIGKLKQMPSEYFEIKPQRGVQVNEFAGAIVPSNTPSSSIDYLRSQGLKDIYYYATPEERKELFKKFGGQMFSVGAAPIGLLAVGEDKKKRKTK